MSNPQVVVTVTANTTPYVTSMNKAAASTSKVDKAAASVTAGAAKQAAKWGASAVALATVTSQTKDTITAATALQDSQAKVGVVFGKSAQQIVDFAADSKKSFGLTKTAALDAASTFAVFGKAAGLTGNDLTKFSTDLTQRAVDMSSFFGKSTEEAITAVGAALRGESEPIRNFGVLLNEDTLRARAFEMQLVSSTKESLTPQTRALAAAAEVMKQSSDAAGDYMRTLDGAANSQKQMTAELGRAKETVGTEVLPAYAKLTALAADLIAWAGKAGVFENLTGFGVIGSLAAILTPTWGAIDDTAASASALGAAAADAAGGVDALAASAGGAAGAVGTMDEQMKAAIGGLFGFIDAQQALAGSQQDMLGLEAELRDSARQTGVASSGSTKHSDKEAAAHKKVADGIRARAKAEEDAEIRRARNAAQRKAEGRVDAGARRDVRKGIAGAIATDKAARRGEDIDGFNQGGSVGEATGSLTKGEQNALDKKIDGIRAKHKKALAEQLKGLNDAYKVARKTGGAVDSYSFSLDANTEAGRRNLATISGQVDKVQTNAQAVYDAAILDGKGAEEAGRMAKDALLKGYDAIMDSATAVGFARSEVDQYLNALGLIPSKITTTFVVKVDDAAMKKWAKEYDWTSTGKGPNAPTPKATPKAPTKPSIAESRRPKWDAKSGGYSMFAAGGEIGGPSGVDNTPIWASRGEFMVNARQYAANRELVRAINAGSGRVTSGGMTIGSVTVHEATPSRVRASVIDALAESAYRRGVVR